MGKWQRWHDERNCARKRRYSSWEEAEVKVLEMIKSGTVESPNPPGPYICPICDGYHLGRRTPLKHSPGSQRYGY